jgi:hypothetical protein
VLPEESSELEGDGECDVVGFEPVISAEVVYLNKIGPGVVVSSSRCDNRFRELEGPLAGAPVHLEWDNGDIAQLTTK